MNKYKLLDEVYYLNDNKVHQGRVLGIRCSDYGHPKNSPIYYDLSIKGLTSIEKLEDEVFTTKEELIKSL